MIEHAGRDTQRIVSRFDTLKKARLYVEYTYKGDEMETLGVDILFNGSTEY